jgi:hypothetical protein
MSSPEYGKRLIEAYICAWLHDSVSISMGPMANNGQVKASNVDGSAQPMQLYAPDV